MDRFLIKNPKPKILTQKEETAKHAECGSSNKNVIHDETNETETSETNENESSFANSSTKEPKPKMKKRYKQKFRQQWKETFKWLTVTENNQSFCTVCHITVRGGIPHFKRHENTSLHIQNYEKAKNAPKITRYIKEPDDKLEKSIKRAELKLVAFINEHNLAFLLMDHLILLLVSIFPDSNIAKGLKCNRTKATKVTKDCLAQEQLNLVTTVLRNQFFSLIIDETTDVSTQKSLVLIARYFDNIQQRSRDVFIGLLRIKNCTAQGIFEAINVFLLEANIPIKNLLGFAADNAAVMMGQIAGVQALFKTLVPNIFVLGCICHSFHLCSSAAAKKLPRSIEEFVRSIYNYFAHSSKRQESLQEFQAFVNVKPHKMLHPSQTRWLSLQAAVDRVLENWDALTLYFRMEATEEDLNSARNILRCLEHPTYKMYFTFLSYILELVNKLNLEFQAEKPKIFNMLTRMSDFYRSLLRSYLKKVYIDNTNLNDVECKNPEYFLPLESIYLGAKTEILMSKDNLDKTELHNFRLRCLEFYTELASQIKKHKALSGEIGSISLYAEKYFPQLVDDIEKLNSEWRLLADLNELKTMDKSDIEAFWSNIFSLKNQLNELMFPHLKKSMQGLLSLPHSSAAAERRFSQVTLLKTKLRNRLEIETLDTILHTKELINNQCCHNWEPSSSLLQMKVTY
ncbi:hypothetical protein NQ315_006573 [Exocentrus adspersus]|uniref:HAT C-terminal dimerisation domain-containing protein n=1 Tax=Exocentrus adspersus TaxID=1586481 RepID=A0AAV8VGI0_9CUCU|nr:hypothetical protein NQ315_006573 [Exocentrus adspersus]